jgi:tetratricopeptide (TPR) repeat protein
MLSIQKTPFNLLQLSFLSIFLLFQYGCTTIEQLPKTVKDVAETPFQITEKIINIEKMPELPKEIFDLGKAPVDIARSFTHLGWQQQFSSVGDRRGQGYSSNGLKYMANENFEEAAYYFQLAAHRDPQNTMYMSLLAWSYFKLAEYEKALAIFQRIKELDPTMLDAYTGPGWIHFKTAHYDQAIQDFSEALSIKPESSEAFAGLGWCHFRKNAIAVAKTYLTIALRKGMKNVAGTEPEAHRALGYLYFSQANFPEALKHFKLAIRHMPNWNDARTKWGDCLFALGKYDESITVYKHALQHEKTAEIYDKLGWAFFYTKPWKFIGTQKKNIEHARSMFNYALAIDPNYKNSQAGLEAVQNKMNGASSN